MKKIDNLFSRRFSRILMFILLDILIMILSSIFSIWLRFDFGFIPDEYIINLYQYLMIDVLIMISIFSYLRLYTSVWAYASIIELLNVIIGCSLTELSIFAYKLIFNINMPTSCYLIHFMLMIILVSGVRYMYRTLKAIAISIENKHKVNKTMLIGAGNAGRLIIDEILRNQKEFNTKIVCVIDDNKEKIGTYLRRVPVVGSRKDISKFAIKYQVNDIIIAIPSATKEDISNIVTECQKTKCDIKILPSIYSEMNKDVAKNIRPLSYEDFLGRDQIVVDSTEIKDHITDKVILVTGGGGSIGSELCRQIAKCEPKKLIIFDIYENNAYEIQQELLRNYPKLDLEVIIGSVRDYDRLEAVFKKYKPDQVFHAAAHKHVPLMEVSPNEAIKNNCLGTLNACKLADIYKVKKFVLISTDKCLLLLIEKIINALKTPINKGKKEFAFS